MELALERPELSSRELAYHLTDNQQIFISDSSVYWMLKSRGEAILQERACIKKKTLLERRKAYQRSILCQNFDNQIKLNSFDSTRNSN